ncbi:DedA family protein [Ancylobacter amanitiformis]|uniref:Membrane protein DedA with SNARE-associated domain n=1 Tax=Ancylobacter amanitiformis TaxID=217069 RepID=A0ABU0LVH3_9HYPH|nr:DedA family protein [Ancylobacter amanitiformis]MDQ0512672.1 membrane protein DedA with SNARE-associated domain [Ancylobacter amanitiformis]
MIELEAYARDALAFVEAHAHWAPYIAFGLAFGESFAVLSLLFPATIVLIGLGPIIEAGGIPFLPVWAGAVAGASLGDAISYWIGHAFKDRVRGAWPLRNHPEAMARGERFFHRFGSSSVFLGRFFGPLRAFVPLIAGMFAMPHFLFQMVNIASAMAWALLLLAPGAAAVKALGW